MEVVNTLFLFNLIMASLMVASLASPLAEEYLRTNEQSSAFGKRQRSELSGTTVKPLLVVLKDYTQKDVEVAANFMSAVFCPHQNGEVQKKFSGAYIKFRECMREEREVILTLKELDGILMKETYEPEDTVAAFRSYCKVSTKILDCLDPLITAMKACLGGGMEYRWRAHRFGRFRPLSDFICSNEDNRTISFFNDNILECADKKTELMRNCTEDYKSYQRFTVECRVSPKVLDCVDPLITATKACLGNGIEARWAAYMLGLIHPMSYFICSNEGNRTISLLEDNVLECTDKKTKLLTNCIEQGYDKNQEEFIVECRKMSEVKKCLTDTLEKCEKPSTSGYFKDLYEITFTNYPCVSNNSSI